MTNLQKRILTSIIILPLSIFFIVKGGYFLIFFLIFILFAGIHELYSVFNKTKSIIFLSLILILSLLSIYYLRENAKYFLYLVIVVSICSDIGGYVFGKIFKWKKLTKISPKKTISGVFGSFFFSFVWLVIVHELSYQDWFYKIFYHRYLDDPGAWPMYFFSIKYFILTIIFSMVAQAGDLTVSHFKRSEKIKDTGKILPGHGGILDRIDGIIFAIPSLTIFINLS